MHMLPVYTPATKTSTECMVYNTFNAYMSSDKLGFALTVTDDCEGIEQLPQNRFG